MSASVRTDVHELEIATEALTALLDHIETTADGGADVDTLAQTVPCCVRIAGLLAALAGRLGTLTTSLVDMSRGEPAQRAAEETMADVAADLSTMRDLLHSVTLVAAPTLVDLRHITAR
jgi:hypothetical protein